MSRKDYKLIANAIANCRPVNPGLIGDAGNKTLDLLVDVLGDRLANDNPAFDGARFIAACKAGAA